MTGLRDRIAAVLTSHLTDEAQYRCWCGLVTGGDEEYTRHVADAVIAELGLRRERVELLTRWVSPWEQDP